MKKVLKAIENITKIKPIPLQTDKAEKVIIYNYYPTAAFKYRLELRVISFTFADATETANAIIKGLCNFGDSNKIEGISAIDLNGGGCLKDNQTNTIHRLMYFDITKGE